jgi:hypothetical protein
MSHKPLYTVALKSKVVCCLYEDDSFEPKIVQIFSDLESHDKNMWGRYSSPSANAGGGFSDNPENE